MIEFIKDIIDNIPNLSRVQIGLFLAVIVLIYVVEHLIFYNSIQFGSLPMPFAANIPATTPSPQRRPSRKRQH